MAKGLSELQKKILLMALNNTVQVRDRTIIDAVETKTILNTLFNKTDDKARITVSKTFKRLEERGLVTKFMLRQLSGFIISSGVQLTTKGIEIAEKING